MSREKPNPAVWSPSIDIPDSECNIFQIWSRYYNQIQKFRNFSERTIYEYTSTLAQINNGVVRDMLVVRMTEWDIWTAVTSAQCKGNGKPYSSSAIMKRFSVFHDIFLYLQTRAVCADPMSIPP